jgi:hypothetical protein
MYNTALLACEANSIGYATCLKIVELKYQNIFYSMPSHFHPNNRKWMERNLTNKDKMVPGFQTTSANRPLLISALEESIRTGQFIIKSTRLYHELSTFIWYNGKAQAQKGFNDDLCISLGISQLIITTMLVDMENAKKRTVAMIDAFESSPNMTTIENQFRTDVQDPYKLQLPNGEEEDYRGWLIDMPSKG